MTRLVDSGRLLAASLCGGRRKFPICILGRLKPSVQQSATRLRASLERDALVPDPTEKHDVSDRFATVVSVQRSGAPLSADLPVVVSSSGRQFIRASYVTTK